MKSKTLLIPVLVVSALIFLSFKYMSSTKESHILKNPSIEGTYKFIWRKLPDGTTIKPPMAIGIQTFTKDIRNFNIMWVDSSGKHFSLSIYSTYKLTDKDYTETIHFGIMNDEISGKGLTYMPNQTKTVPVKMMGDKLEIKLPFDPPTVTFEGNKITAIAEGQFEDYWEKVK
ncbi:MAG TPA: hypothetical protein VMT35_17610 [Ignavibacteriaceae bacterium]|nr:hypothetical protein [Ignavibacteriaceae bacterium]